MRLRYDTLSGCLPLVKPKGFAQHIRHQHDEIEFDAMPIMESLKFEELPEPGSDPSPYWLFGLAQGTELCEQWGGPFEVYGPFDEDNADYVAYYEWRRKNDASA